MVIQKQVQIIIKKKFEEIKKIQKTFVVFKGLIRCVLFDKSIFGDD